MQGTDVEPLFNKLTLVHSGQNEHSPTDRKIFNVVNILALCGAVNRSAIVDFMKDSDRQLDDNRATSAIRSRLCKSS